MADDPLNSGLTMPKNLGVPERTPVNRKIHARWDTFEEVDASLKAKGFADCHQPVTLFPNLTAEQLTQTPNREYTALHAVYLEWYRYTAEEFARLRALALQIKNEMDDIQYEIKKELRNRPGKRPSEDDIAVAIGTHGPYKELKQLQQRAEQAKELLGTKVDYLERSLRVISRQVELRKIDAGQGGVNDHMPSRGRGPYGTGGFPPVRGPGE